MPSVHRSAPATEPNRVTRSLHAQVDRREFIAAAEAAGSSIVELERVIGRAPDTSSTDGLFDPPRLRWYRQTQHFDAQGYVGLLRTWSLYGSLPDHVREPLLAGIETHIRTHMDDRARRDYLIAARLARRADP
jgi:hypothetical protein